MSSCLIAPLLASANWSFVAWLLASGVVLALVAFIARKFSLHHLFPDSN